MRSFFKMFFASFIALIIFSLLVFFIGLAVVSGIVSKEKPDVQSKSVVVLNLGNHFAEYRQPSPTSILGEADQPSLYEVIRLIEHAKNDDKISGIYIQADGNGNGPAANNELRKALLDFKSSKKFIIAYGDRISQQGYFLASVADKVYVNPAGDVEWTGFSTVLPFIKGTLDKLEIEPQIFYAGKFKSATEIFRTDKMTPENRLQTTVFLNSLYNYFLQQVSFSRSVDTTTLHQLASNMAIRSPQDALNAKLVDGVRYDDEVKDEMKKKLDLDKFDKLNLVPISTYSEAVNLRKSESDRIAVIYAEGNIVDGEGSTGDIGGEKYRALIRKVRLDKRVKAIVLRVNSGGGSALASEIIWRELRNAREEDGKPVIVSFGDVAASGGYYIACGADSIFASPNTITGSIGVFGVIPNMQRFFKDKLGVTFDNVSTASNGDGISITEPLDQREQQVMQQSIERIYNQFKQRVAQGRKKDVNYIDSIAQGRVWSGSDALQIGLVDRIGTLEDAIAAAASKAKLDKYSLLEYPESEGFMKQLLNRQKTEPSAMIKAQVGEDGYRVFQQLKEIRELTGSVQARLPYEIIIR